MRLFAVVLSLALAGLVSGQDVESPESIMDAVARPAPAPRPDDGTLPPRPVHELRSMLVDGRFIELETYFESLAFQVTRDIRREQDLAAAYLAFHDPDADRSADFERWVDQAYRRSGVPFVARSLFLSAQAIVADREDDDQLRRILLEQAREDAARARQVAPNDLGAYLADALAGAVVYTWSDRDAEVLRRGLERFPASLVLRQAVVAPNPAWMRPDTAVFRTIVSEAERHHAANPALETLPSWRAVGEAWGWIRRERPDAALRILDDEPDGIWPVHLARAWALHSDHRHGDGLVETNRALALAPDQPSVLALRSAVLTQVSTERSLEERRQILEQAMADAVDARRLGPLANHEYEYTAWAIVRRDECVVSTFPCWARGFIPDEGHPADPEEGWKMALLFLVSIPITLIMVVFQGNELALLAAPLIVALDLGWNAIEWRRQRYWTPWIIHASAAASVLLLVGINVAWVRAGGEMWVQRYVVIASVALVPYMIYLALAGPRILRRLGRVPPDRLPPGSDVEPLPQAPMATFDGPRQ